MGKRPDVSLKRCAVRVGQFFLDLFFERMKCPVCQGESKGLCMTCLRSMEEWGSFDFEGIQGHAMLHYSGTAQKLIYAYKKRLSFEALRGFELIIAKWLKDHELAGFDFIVPVTSIPANVRQRGFDPAFRLAKILSKHSGIPLLNCLENRGKKENKTRNYRDRKEQAGKALYLRLSEHQDLSGRRILIFDDVMTTGSTMKAAAALIKAKGADVEFLVTAQATA